MKSYKFKSISYDQGVFMKILLLALTLMICSCANIGHNNGFLNNQAAGNAAMQSANDAAAAAATASQPMMFTPPAGGF